MKHRADNTIINRVKNGSPDQYQHIVKRYQDRIFSLMMRMTRSYHHAEELSQDTFMKAYAKLDRFDTDKAFFPWLYTIALNTGRDFLRKNKLDPVFFDGFPELKTAGEQRYSQEKAVETKQALSFIESGLARLSHEHREAIILKYRYECSIKEISQIFNISISAAKMRVHRGLEQLKKEVNHELT